MPNDNEWTLKLERLFSRIEAGRMSLKEVRSTYEEEIAFDFDPLTFFSINENTVSWILAYFLNPSQKHGQGDALLRVFLEKLECKEALRLLNSGKQIQTTTQYYTTKGRPIDIVITFGSNEFIIGIENKVWGATDQPEQVESYIDDIISRVGNNFIFIYMSPVGDPPSKESISKEKWDEYQNENVAINMAFNRTEGVAVLPILKAMADEAKADNVRMFLKILYKRLYGHFIGEHIMDESKLVKDYLSNFVRENNGDHLELTMEIERQIGAVKTGLELEMKRQYEEIANDLNAELKVNEENMPKFIPEGWVNHGIKLSKEEGGSIIFGIIRSQEDKHKTALSPRCIANMGRGEWMVSPWWICWNHLYRNWKNNPKYFKAICDGTLKENVKSFLKKCIEIGEVGLKN